MTPINSDRSLVEKGEPLRQRVLDAAERLLRDGEAEFSMRDLAAAAGVSFATPFNQFGNKAAIMHALSERRIETMAARFDRLQKASDASTRIRVAVEIAVAVMLEEPAVNRSVMGWIGSAGQAPGEALARSTALWTLAIGAGEGIAEGYRARALSELPWQLALGFRGALSFWSARELSDEALGPAALAIANSLLCAYSGAPAHPG